MDDYDYQSEYDNFDTADFDTLGNTDPYQGMGQDHSGITTNYTPDSWGAGGYQQGQDGTQFWQNQSGQYAGYQNPQGQFTPYDYSGGGGGNQPGIDWSKLASGGLGAITSALGNKSGANNLGAVGGILAGILNNRYQKQQGSTGQQIAQNYQQQQDPFAAQRARYQQELGMSQDRINAFQQDPSQNAQYANMQNAVMDEMRRYGRAKGMTPEQLQQQTASKLSAAQQSVLGQLMQDRAGLAPYTGANMHGDSSGLQALLAANTASNAANSGVGYLQGLGFGSGAYGSGSGSTNLSPELQAALAKMYGGQ